MTRDVNALVCSMYGGYYLTNELIVKAVHGKDASTEEHNVYVDTLPAVSAKSATGEDANVHLRYMGSGGREPPFATILRAFTAKTHALALAFNVTRRSNIEALTSIYDQIVINGSNPNANRWYMSHIADDDDTETATEETPKKEPGAFLVNKRVVVVGIVPRDDGNGGKHERETTRKECEELAAYWNADYVEVDLATCDGINELLTALATPADTANLPERLKRISEHGKSAKEAAARRAEARKAEEKRRKAEEKAAAKAARAPSKLYSTVAAIGTKVASYAWSSKTKKRSGVSSQSASSIASDASTSSSVSSASLTLDAHTPQPMEGVVGAEDAEHTKAMEVDAVPATTVTWHAPSAQPQTAVSVAA